MIASDSLKLHRNKQLVGDANQFCAALVGIVHHYSTNRMTSPFYHLDELVHDFCFKLRLLIIYGPVLMSIFGLAIKNGTKWIKYNELECIILERNKNIII